MKILFLVFLNCILANFEFIYKKTKNINSDIEFIFNAKFDFIANFTQKTTINKYFHKYKQSELNLYDGTRLKCYTPSKIQSVLTKEIENDQNMIKEIPNKYIRMFMRENIKMCYYSQFKELYYKLCPMKSAIQTLIYKKKDNYGDEYTETWILGQAENRTDIDPIEVYRNETGDYNSFNLPNEPYVIVKDNLVKIFNYNLAILQKFEAYIIIEYEYDKIKHMPDLIVNKLYNLSQYITEINEVTTIPVQREIISVINKNIILLDSPFPLPTVNYKVNLSLKKERLKLQLEREYDFIIYGDMVHCWYCVYLTHYKVGDTLFIKNSTLDKNERMYESARIVEIIDNKLLRVHKPFSHSFNGPILLHDYFLLSSMNFTQRYKFGDGKAYIRDKFVFGINTQFKKQIQTGDSLLFYNYGIGQNFYYQQNTSPLKFLKSSCVVSKILTDNLLLLENFCFFGLAKYKIFFIIKPFDDFPIKYSKPLKSDIPPSLIDFHTPQMIEFYQGINSFHSQFLFHSGFVLTNYETVFSFRLLKHVTVNKSFFRFLFGTEEHNYDKGIGKNDIEMIIDAQNGVLIKSVNDNENLQFYQVELKNFFSQSLLCDIIIQNDEIFFNSVDEDTESSIKVSFKLPLQIKYMYVDQYAAKEMNIVDIIKKNFIELKFLFNIYVYNLKSRLSPGAFFSELLVGGQFCSENQNNRTTTVEYRCDLNDWNDINIEKVTEPEVCNYKYFVRSKNLCNPYVVMKNKVLKTVEKTRCIISNDNYNSEISFLKFLNDTI